MTEKNNKNLQMLLGIITFVSILMFIYYIVQYRLDISIIFLFISSICCFIGLILSKQLKNMLKLLGASLIIIILFIILGGIANSFNEIFKKDMLSFYGTIIGSLIAGILGVGGAVYGAKIGSREGYKASIETLNKQVSYEKELREQQKEENRKNVIKVITKFLKEEIIDNKIIIEDKNLFSYLEKDYGTQYGYDLKLEIKFNSYEKLKFELVKFADVKLVEEVIDLYELFYILVRHSDINQFDKNEYSKLLGLRDKINNVINADLQDIL